MARRLSSEARHRILAAGRSLLVEAGLDAFTVDDVAARSGVAKTTIYRHFESVNELLVATLDQMIVPFPVPDTGSLREDLLAVARAVLPVFADPNLRRLLLGVVHAAAGDDELDRIHRAMIAERKCPLQVVLDAARSRGEIPADLDFEVAFHHVEGPFISRWLHQPGLLGEMDLEDTVDRVIAALCSLDQRSLDQRSLDQRSLDQRSP